MPPVRYVKAATVRIEREPGAIHLRIHLDDRCVRSGKLKSAFPLSNPDQLISILDGKGDEVAIIEDPAQLDPQSQEMMQAEFDRRYFTPRLAKLLVVRLEAGMWHFVADSQRGEVDFFVRNWRDSAQEITPGRWYINSVDGARYEIADLEKMDAGSRKLMDQLL